MELLQPRMKREMAIKIVQVCVCVGGGGAGGCFACGRALPAGVRLACRQALPLALPGIEGPPLTLKNDRSAHVRLWRLGRTASAGALFA